MSLVCPTFISTIDTELCRSIDQYCERLGPNWDAEPINALTNLAFVFSAWFSWRHFSKIPEANQDRFLIFVIATIPMVGLGSVLFHTLATRWAEWADVIPIMLFMLLYLWIIVRRFFGLSKASSLIALLLFSAATFGLEAIFPKDFLMGGAMYLPTIAVLVVVGNLAPNLNTQVRHSFHIAVILFLFSYAMRSLDQPLCNLFPFGTHFLWHLLNALLLYLLVRVAIAQRAYGK